MIKALISGILRRLGLIYSTDRLRYRLEKLRNSAENKRFRCEHPEVALPPDYLIYESFQLNYRKYYSDSFNTAKGLVEQFSKHIDINNISLLDWGCGPGRIIRHMPGLLPSSSFSATDYNADSIEWCRKNIPQVAFNLNTLEARLPYFDNTFDVIYGISIFTHLSEKLHYEWYNELHRVLKPGGILYVTCQGDNFLSKLNPAETKQYLEGKLVVRGNVKEGHRTYSAFHPPAFMKQLFSNADIAEQIETRPQKGSYPPQDIWIVRKPASK